MIGLEVTTRPIEALSNDVRRVQREERAIIDAFHRLWYAAPFTYGMTYWHGVPTLKNPMDLFSVQDIIHDLRPGLIIETGTAFGGSALFYAHLCDLNDRGSVVSIDLDPGDRLPRHPRITYRTGSSIAPAMIAEMQRRALDTDGHVLVLLDADHHYVHVRAELDAYADLVTPASFLIVEDTNVNGHPVLPSWGPGPYEAVEDFLRTHPEFQAAAIAERYLLTMHPGGWLKKVA